jgi:aryl-alcohol dehydrogenase-like predicted oxidoreductase
MEDLTMVKRMLGRTGLEISVLGFGGAEIGYENAPLADVEKLLGGALDAGLNLIDTAECYADSETKIGQAVSHRRGDFFLFTKVGHAAGFELPDWDLRMMEQSIDRSLQRLQADHVDLIQLHTCSEDMLRQGDVIEVLQRAKSAGKTRFVGYSGDSKAALYAVTCGAFDTLQTSVNIADQECIELTLPKAKEAGMGVIAKRPIANVAWRTGSEKPANGYVLSYWERLQKLAYPFLADGVTDAAISTALRFTLAQPAVTTAIVGTKNPERWQKNAALLAAGPLPEAEINAIRERWKAVCEPEWVGQG